MAMNIIVLMIIMSFALYLGTPDHSSTMFFSLLSGKTTIIQQLYILLTAAGLIGVAAGLFGVSPTYALFTAITSFLVGFFVLPTEALLR